MTEIEKVDERFQDHYAIKKLQEKVNEIIKVFNDSCTPQTPEVDNMSKEGIE